MKKVLNTKIKDMKAITLIALVITIIILLILAGVTIGFAMSGNGLFEKSKLAVDKYNNAVNEENSELEKSINNIEDFVSGNRDNVSKEEYNKLLNEVEQLKGEYTGEFYLSGTAQGDGYSRTSYFDINVKNYNKIEIDVTEIFGNSSVYTCYINGDGKRIENIVGTGKHTINTSDYETIRIYYYENDGYYFVRGTYTLSNEEADTNS